METITKEITMNDRTIEKELNNIANTIKELHDKLIAMHFSHRKSKQQGSKILSASGRLWEAYCVLKDKI